MNSETDASSRYAAGVYIVFSVDFFVMRWLRSRGERRLAAMNAANGDSPAESIESSSHKYVVTLLEACRIAILITLINSEKEHIHGQHDLGHCHGPAREIATDYSSPQAHFDVLILEAGIIFHSIMIGVSLGASGGDQWIPLFIAIVFHQLFEGLALGSRIGQLVWPAGKGWKKWAMSLAFGVSAGSAFRISNAADWRLPSRCSSSPRSGSPSAWESTRLTTQTRARLSCRLVSSTVSPPASSSIPESSSVCITT